MLWVCQKCTTRYAAGLAACPQCGSTDYVPSDQAGNAADDDGEKEGDVPKTTLAGTTNALGRDPDWAPFGTESDPEGSDQPSAGGSSSTSSSTGPKSSSSTPPGPPQPAPGAESPSSTPPPATPESPTSSSAATTDGDTPRTGSAQNPSDDDGGDLKSKLLG